MWNERETEYYSKEIRADALADELERTEREYAETWRDDIRRVYYSIMDDIYNSIDWADADRDGDAIRETVKAIIVNETGEI